MNTCLYASLDVPSEVPLEITIPLNGTQVEIPLSRSAGLHFAGSALNLANTALAIWFSKTPIRKCIVLKILGKV